jgi:hypothetical protein
MQSLRPDSGLCAFDADSRRCLRCGYIAQEWPYYRVCRTLEEEARAMVEHHATHRISVPPVPLGDAAAAVLRSIGITKERMRAAMGKECGCQKRQNRLNEIGRSISSGVELAANAVANVTLPHPVDSDEVAAVANAMARSPATNPGLIAKQP